MNRDQDHIQIGAEKNKRGKVSFSASTIPRAYIIIIHGHKETAVQKRLQ